MSTVGFASHTRAELASLELIVLGELVIVSSP
jgi:hypothetical protein